MTVLSQNAFSQEVLLQVLVTLHIATYPSEWNIGGLAWENQEDVHPKELRWLTRRSGNISPLLSKFLPVALRVPGSPSLHACPTHFAHCVWEVRDFYMLMYCCSLSPTHIPWHDVSLLKQALVSTIWELTDAADRVLLLGTYHCSPSHLRQQCSILSLSICKYIIHMSA